jgi:TPR repeat protein
MGYLGLLYEKGFGVAHDYAKAREWYEKAAAGNEMAMGYLGLLYEKGFGVAQDFDKAREWYEKAAEKGDTSAKARLEQLPPRRRR